MDPKGTLFLPGQNSILAPEVDGLFYFILYFSIFFFVLVVGGTFYFAWKYRQKGERKFTANIHGNNALEILWTVIPTILVFIVFVWGFKTYLKVNIPPANSMQVKVTAQKWFWTFTYPDGITTTNKLVVPQGQPVRLLMSSKDVIHSFFVPNFRTKMDVLPNRYTEAWFQSDQVGDYDLFCTEYCGTGHSSMIGKVKVVSADDYKSWLVENGGPGENVPPEEYGAKLYKEKTCFTCHTIDGKPGVGPTFKGLWGEMVELTNGKKVKVDENYIRESILDPQAKIVKGFQPVMPTFQGIVKEKDIDAIIAYFKSLK